MARPDKKQRHKAKRQAKQREKRRQQGISPLKRLADAPGELECWMSQDFEEFGQCEIFIYKRAAGLSGVASFLIDRGVVGLKDAWFRIGFEHGELMKAIQACNDRGITMRRVPLDEARHRIAGGLRWARENGMRLPKDWVRTASLLGGVGNWESADVSMFIKEFAGHPEDLRQRLIGEPFESYVRRKDVQFVFTDAIYLDQETGEYVSPEDELDLDDLDDDEIAEIAADVPMEELEAMMERLAPAATKLAEKTTAWLATLDQSPSPQLLEAWQHVILARMLAKSAMPDESDARVADFTEDLLEEMCDQAEPEVRDERWRGIEQALDHLEIDPTLMQAAQLATGVDIRPDGELDWQPPAASS